MARFEKLENNELEGFELKCKECGRVVSTSVSAMVSDGELILKIECDFCRNRTEKVREIE